MKTAIIYGTIAALICLLFMYLDSRLLDNPKTKTTYLKNMLMVGIIVGGGIYLIGEGQFEKMISDSGEKGGVSDFIDMGDEMMTGEPRF